MLSVAIIGAGRVGGIRADVIRRSDRSLVICGAQPQPLELIKRSKLFKLLGVRNIQPHLDAALERAVIIHGGFDSPHARIPA